MFEAGGTGKNRASRRRKLPDQIRQRRTLGGQKYAGAGKDDLRGERLHIQKHSQKRLEQFFA